MADGLTQSGFQEDPVPVRGWEIAHLPFPKNATNEEVNAVLAKYWTWEPFSTMYSEDDEGNPIWILSLRRIKPE